MAIVTPKGYFLDVLLPHLDLMVSRAKINFCEIYSSMQLIQQLVNPGYGVPIFIIFLFKARKSMHILIVPSFFFTKTTDEAKRA
jgi:hypothetical protein